MPRHVHPNPFIIHPADDLVRKQPELRRASHALSLKYASSTAVSEEALQVMGRALWDALGLQKEFDAAHSMAGAAIFPVIIESNAADVQALPWETLHHPTHGFIGKHTGFTLTRRMQPPQDGIASLEKGPLRVLLFTSLPDDVNPETGRLSIEEEQIQVQEALMPWISKGLVRLELPDDGRFSTLKALLKSFQPHILFLSGHGKFQHEPHTGEAPYGEIFFESESGISAGIREDEIAKALTGTGVQAVILSACESGKAASDALTNGLTQRLSVQGIPHVIGMRESILDIAGIQFTRALCDELAGRERIDTALQAARIAILTPLKDMPRREAGNSVIENLSLGQWCLPMLLSPNPQLALIDWDFQPKEVEARLFNRTINTVSLPTRFVGRRAEMRRYKNDLLNGRLQKLLITGPGGQGKTSLAGRLALDLRQQGGYQIFVWNAQLENPMRDFELDVELALDNSRIEKYDHIRARVDDLTERAKHILELLMEQYNGHIVLFFDNLESIQDSDTMEIKDGSVAAWLDAAYSTQGLILLATSRWKLPKWDGEHLSLSHTNYGDFLQIASLKKLHIQRGRMRRVFDALGGNIRGLEFFAAATRDMNDESENAFLQTLEHTKSDLQTNLAIAEIYRRLPDDAKKLLARLPAYQVAVPVEGLLKLGLDLPNAESLLERLMAVSLLEASYEPHWDVTEYQVVPMVTDWMGKNEIVDNNPEWLRDAAMYHAFLHINERQTLLQAIRTHQALRRAGYHSTADYLALNYIVPPMTRAGLYFTLLQEWLPRICESDDLQVRALALNHTGKLGLHTGNFDMALSYLKQSLAICRQIGEKEGESTALNNIAIAYQSQGDHETALEYFKQVLTIVQQIDNKALEGHTLGNIAQIYHSQGDYTTALEYEKISLEIAREIGDKAGEGVMLNNISQIYQAQGDYNEALTYLRQALEIYYQESDIAGISVALNNVSQIYYLQSNYEAALDYLKQVLAICQQIGDKVGEGRTFQNIGNSYSDLGDYETALEYYKQALTIFRQSGYKRGEATVLNSISHIYDMRGDYDTRLTYAKQSLAINQQLGDKAGEAAALNAISGHYWRQKNYEEALVYLQQSLMIRQQIGDKAGQDQVLNNIGEIYRLQGDYGRALDYLKQALSIQRQLGNLKGQGVTLNNLSLIYKALDDFETAVDYLKQSLDIREQIGDKAGLCTTLFNMGIMYAENNQIQEAGDTWIKAYILAKQINYAHALGSLSQLAPILGMPEGLEGWEILARRIQNGEKIEFEKDDDESN